MEQGIDSSPRLAIARKTLLPNPPHFHHGLLTATPPRRLPRRPGRVLAALAIGGLLPPAAPRAATAGTAPPQAPAGVTVTAAPAVPPLFGGIQVNEPDHGAWVRAVGAAGLNAVQVTLYARQQAWNGPKLYWEREIPGVLAEIRAAARAGLRTVLVMRVALEHGLTENRHLWHGMIWPSDADLAAWMDRYREFVLWGAEIAAAEGVDMFVLGNELTSLTSTRPVQELPDLYSYYLDRERVAAVRQALVDCAASVRDDGGGADLVQLDGGRYPTLEAMLLAEEAARRAWALEVVGGDPGELASLNRRRAAYERFWRRLAGSVREAYTGPIAYGANFDQYDDVGFWDALDAVAINAYFPLGLYGLEAAARRERFRESWRGVAASLRATGDLPVLFLELGWTRRDGATVRPYSYDRVEVLESAGPGAPLRCVHWASQPLAPLERVDAMGALADVVAEGAFPSLRGLMLWKLTTRPAHRSIEPFAIVLTDEPGSADRQLLLQAARIAGMVRDRVAT